MSWILLSNIVTSVCETVLCGEDFSGTTTISSFVFHLQTDLWGAAFNAVRDGHYLSRVGSFLPSGHILKTTQKEQNGKAGFYYYWPMKEIKPIYERWERGKHWYVRLGNEMLNYQGQTKWNTRAGAENAFNMWTQINH